VFLCLIPVRSGLNCSFSSVSRFLEPSVPLLFFGQESYFRSVSPARLVFFWRFCCPRRRFSRVDSPARVQSSRPAARSSIPDRTGQERARPVLAPVPDSRTGDSAPGFLDLSQASPARSARGVSVLPVSVGFGLLGLVTPYCSRSGRSSCVKQRDLFCLVAQ
jgi:hypothetical protein